MNVGRSPHCDNRAMSFDVRIINMLGLILKVESEIFTPVCREIATDIFGFPGKGR